MFQISNHDKFFAASHSFQNFTKLKIKDHTNMNKKELSTNKIFFNICLRLTYHSLSAYRVF